MKTEQFLSRYRRPVLAGVLLLFGVLYALLSVVNHVMFRTYGLDLGLYTNALYDYAHLRGNDSTFFLWQPSPLLADHFDLYLVLLSPLVYLLGPYTLLVVQIVAVLCGAYGVYRLARLYAEGELVPMVSMLLLLTSFGVWHALGFDYHSNVVAAMLLPWLLHAVKRGRLLAAALLAVGIAIAKETSALWLVFILVALIFDYRRERCTRLFLTVMAVCAVAYTAAVTMWVMPQLGGTGRGAWRYEWMGNGFAAMAGWILSHPIQAVADVFVNFTDNPSNNPLKTEFFLCALASGLVFCFLKPNYLLMILPPLAMKMLSSDAAAFWGIAYHYNVEICMVSVVAAAIVLPRVRKVRWRAVAAQTALALSVLTLFYTVSNPHAPIRKDNMRLYDSRHWHQRDFDASTARRLIRQIPSDASVCATTMFTPHIATRNGAYIFPMGLGYDAEWYLLLNHNECYYEGEEEQVHKMINDTVHYRVVDHDEDVYLLVAKDFVER